MRRSLTLSAIYKYLFLIQAFLFLTAFGLSAQKKEIPIDPDFKANSDVFKIKAGAQWPGKMARYQFGNYKVIDSKVGWIVTSTRSNAWNTQSKSLQESKFSFVLQDGESSTATVNTLHQVSRMELRSLELFSSSQFSFAIGNDQLEESAGVFVAIIQTSRNTEDDWVLSIEHKEDENLFKELDGVLENGSRSIIIKPVHSGFKENSNSFPALGYALLENGTQIGAIQYFSGMLGGGNQNKIWLQTDLDSDTKIVIAAGMTALLEMKQREMGY